MDECKPLVSGKESATIKDIANSSISLKEFINIFTKDGVDVPTLKVRRCRLN